MAGSGRGGGRGCRCCGYRHQRGNCPATGKKCALCGKYNHFARVCFSNPENQVTSDGSSVYDQSSTSDNSDYEGIVAGGRRGGPPGPPVRRQRVSSDLEDGGSLVSSVPSSAGLSEARGGSGAGGKKGCFNCGQRHPRGRCPAFGLQCSSCLKMNHLPQQCFSNLYKSQSVGVASPSSAQNIIQPCRASSGAIPKQPLQNSLPQNSLPPPRQNISQPCRASLEAIPNQPLQNSLPQNSLPPPRQNISQPCRASLEAIPNQPLQNSLPQNSLPPPRQNISQPCRASSGAIPKLPLQNSLPPPRQNSLPPPQQNSLPPPPLQQTAASGGRCFLKICTLNHNQIVKLPACGHSFFRNCLAESILDSEADVMRCPASAPCNYIIPPAKIQEILSPLEFSLYQSKEKTYQCRTPGCEAWVTYRKTPRGFQCPACKRVNCLMCKDIHTEKPCEFLEDILNYPNEKNTDPIKNLKDKKVELYPILLDLHTLELVLYPEPFLCPICFEEYLPMEGVILKQCLHVFCRQCLQQTITLCDNDAEVKCPYRDDIYACQSSILEYEIKALLSLNDYEKRLEKTLKLAEQKMKNSFHCKTPNCGGWCEVDPEAEEFVCPICFEENCLICAVIHAGMTCQEYQNSFFIELSEGEIERMIRTGEAMRCPQCSALITKIEGCDGMTCPFCRLDICWVTKRARWGPGGKGDFSGGCQCNLNGRKCHPACANCH